MSLEDEIVDSPEELPFTRLEGQADEATVFRCPLCGARFTHGLQTCASCPINAGCALVTCPECEYSFPRTSRVVGWLRRVLRRNGRSRRQRTS